MKSVLVSWFCEDFFRDVYVVVGFLKQMLCLLFSIIRTAGKQIVAVPILFGVAFWELGWATDFGANPI